MIRSLLVIVILTMLSFTAPAQAARELVCQGYGHTARPGNIRIPVDYNNMPAVRDALQTVTEQIARIPRMRAHAEVCAGALSEARRWPDQMANLEYSYSLLSRCNQALETLPTARSEVIPDLYRRHRVDNLNWQPFFTELLSNSHLQADSGTCTVRLVRQPLTAGLDTKQIAHGTAVYDKTNLQLRINWDTKGVGKSKTLPPTEVSYTLNANGEFAGPMKVFHLWGEEHAAGTETTISIAGFRGQRDQELSFNQPVDDHWTMNIIFEECAPDEVKPIAFERGPFEGQWGRDCATAFTLRFVDETTLRYSSKFGDRTIDLNFRYSFLQGDVYHQPTGTKLQAGDLVTYYDDGMQAGTIWRLTDGMITQVLAYMRTEGSETEARMIDSGFMRRDGLLVANGQGVSEDGAPLKRMSC